MTVSSIMTEDVVTVEMDDSLSTVRDIFDHMRFHHLLVVEKGRLVGVLSDRDLLKALSPYLNTVSELPRDADTLNKRVHQIMNRRPITVDKDTSIETAARLLLAKRVSCLPVISPENSVEGIVTWEDLFRAFLQGADVEP